MKKNVIKMNCFQLPIEFLNDKQINYHQFN